MEFKTFVRKPFQVEAVEITPENMAEIAEMIGGRIKTEDDSGVDYIQLNRQIIPNVGKAYVGWWVTRLGENFRCYAPKVFFEQFSEIKVGEYGRITEGGNLSSEDAGLRLINSSDPAPVDVA